MPEGGSGEYHRGSPVGVPLEEVARIPGMAAPRDGYLVPSDAPGFGMEIEHAWITPWQHGQQGGNDLAVAL